MYLSMVALVEKWLITKEASRPFISLGMSVTVNVEISGYYQAFPASFFVYIGIYHLDPLQ